MAAAAAAGASDWVSGYGTGANQRGQRTGGARHGEYEEPISSGPEPAPAPRLAGLADHSGEAQASAEPRLSELGSRQPRLGVGGGLQGRPGVGMAPWSQAPLRVRVADAPLLPNPRAPGGQVADRPATGRGSFPGSFQSYPTTRSCVPTFRAPVRPASPEPRGGRDGRSEARPGGDALRGLPDPPRGR